MADLVVDYEALTRSEESLRAIADVLRHAEAHRDATDGIWGSTRVASAMAGFVDNWNRHRTELVGSLDGVARLCATTRDGFARTDSQLGAALAPQER